MATSYWDYNDWRNGTTSSSHWHSTNDTTASGTFYINPNWFNRVVVTVRKILVPKPEQWTDEQTLKFTALVNHETKTGWKVTMLIKGNILITDPNVERREMKEFIPLLKEDASREDVARIEVFFQENPVDPPKQETP